MDNIKSIYYFNSAYNLLQAEMPEKFPLNSEDMEIFFRNFDNFEGIEYYLINGEKVVTTDGFFTIGKPQTVEEIYNNIVDLYLESIR